MSRCVECGVQAERCTCTKGPKTMDLPAGKTCDRCFAFKHCTAFLGNVSGNTTCDWFPVRFIEVPQRATRAGAAK